MKIRSLCAYSLIALCCLSCGNDNEKKQFIRPVKVITVDARSEVRRDFAGIVDAVKYVNLAFRVSGQIIELPVVEGQKVSKGQLIARIDPREIKLQYDAAKANYETTKAKMERNERLLQKQAVSQQEYEMVLASYEQAKSNYEAQQNNLDDCYLRAPFAGSIATRQVENYQRVNAGQAIVNLIDSKDLQIAFTVPDNYLSYIQGSNKSFTVEFDMYRGIRFTARLKEYVEASPDGSGIPVFLVIDDARFKADEYDIKPGFSCNVSMTVRFADKAAQTPSIPLTAVFGAPENNNKYVWIYDSSTSTVHKKQITTGSLTQENSIMVTAGLKGGETVVTAGVTQLVEGEKVKILK